MGVGGEKGENVTLLLKMYQLAETFDSPPFFHNIVLKVEEDGFLQKVFFFS